MNRPRDLRKSIRRDFLFTLRRNPIPGDLRPEWRIAVILLMILRVGHGGSLSLKKAHLLNWAIRDRVAGDTLNRMLAGNRRLQDIPVRFDPALNRALDFALGEKLIKISAKTTGSILSLEPSGKTLADKLYNQTDCLDREKKFFDGVRGKLPEPKVQELLEWETEL